MYDSAADTVVTGRDAERKRYNGKKAKTKRVRLYTDYHTLCKIYYSFFTTIRYAVPRLRLCCQNVPEWEIVDT